MLQLATNLEPRKLCSWFLCVLRVYCVNGHAFGLCPGFWVRLLPLTWNNCTVALYLSLWGVHYETLPATDLQQTFLTIAVISSHRCIASLVIWFLFSLQCLSSILTPKTNLKTAQIIMSYFKIVYFVWFFFLKLWKLHSAIPTCKVCRIRRLPRGNNSLKCYT